ncbi:MAG: hypothetical protein ACI9OJ_001932, partial [Myxococcota bacterium]
MSRLAAVCCVVWDEGRDAGQKRDGLEEKLGNAASEQRGALGMRWSGRPHPDSFGRVCSAAFEERIVGRTVGIFCHQLRDATGEGFGQSIDLSLSPRSVGFEDGVKRVLRHAKHAIWHQNMEMQPSSCAVAEALDPDDAARAWS